MRTPNYTESLHALQRAADALAMAVIDAEYEVKAGATDPDRAATALRVLADVAAVRPVIARAIYEASCA